MLLAIAAAVLYVMSINGTVYQFTTPVEMAHHVLLRKIYAVGAFAVLGFLLERSRFARLRGVLAAGIAVALYSYAIEIGQITIDHAFETFAQHTFDVVSGLVGGALGAFPAIVFRDPRSPARRVEAIVIACSLAALLWGFSVTYALIDKMS